MLEGKCRHCGYHCVGWALRFARNQACPKCGTGLEITQNGRAVAEGYTPFNAEEYVIKLPDEAPPKGSDKEQ